MRQYRSGAVLIGIDGILARGCTIGHDIAARSMRALS
jgi:hypothetical protein